MLEAPEASTFEGHLAECDVCRAEARAFGEVSSELASALPVSRPAPRVKAELLRRTAPLRFRIRADEGAWQATPFAGVEVRQLFVDASTGNITSLVRLAAGAKYPPHRHAGLEHCYVLDGDLVFTDHTLHAGDYEVNAPGTDHSPVTSHAGCLLLIINNQDDQVFPS